MARKDDYESVDHPPHYNFGNVEVIEAIEAWGWGEGFLCGTVVKHLARAGKKPGADEVEDLEKSLWYLLRHIGNKKKARKAAKRAKKRKKAKKAQEEEAMKLVDMPKVYFVGKTMIHEEGLRAYLADIGLEEDDWFADPRVSDAENLMEVAGRLCYRSWAPWDPKKPEATNPNVRKVREGNHVYLPNIIKSGHGAVLEHANFSFIFRDVSRVFTHELVRHRAGWAYSQESLRYVRLTDLRFWLPETVLNFPGAPQFFRAALGQLEKVQQGLFELYQIDAIKSFAEKKKLTSMFRRLAPIGLATTIMATGNARAWRHVIKMRTETHAEEEIRVGVGAAAEILKREYPNLFYDMNRNEAGEWKFDHEKV